MKIQNKRLYEFIQKIKFKALKIKRKIKWQCLKRIYPNSIWVGSTRYPLPTNCARCNEPITKDEQDDCTVTDWLELLCPFCTEEENTIESRRVWACDNIRGYD